MTDGLLGFATATFGAVLGPPSWPIGRGSEPLTGGIAPYHTYPTKDGQAMSIGALEPKFWAAFCAGTGLPFEMAALMPGPHQAALKEQVADIFRSRTREEWIAFGAEHDCCLEPVLDPREVPADPHIAARELFFEIASARGAVPQVRTPVTPAGANHAPAPRMGEHTRAILREGGLSDDEVEALLQAGAAREAV
jgi:crotonobetainyl-CoA:carnitine CoA-transferase CaiB-like acyl-CoA transferase